jgi:hypothetical protein
MYNKNIIDVEYGIQVIFSTIPHNNGQRFVKNMDKEYFSEYKKDIKSEDQFLYKPLKYYMLGDYDICYISLINNFKFSHRLFETKSTNGEKESHFNSHTFQSYSGFALNKSEKLEDLFNNQPKNHFIGVIHLKLNNGLYIGNGLSYIEAIYKHIEFLMDGKPYLLTQTFSWFELSLAIFIDTPQELTDVLVKLRTSKFDKIAKEGDFLYENCLYNCEFILDKKNVLKASLFSDTNTNIGFYHELIETDKNSNVFKKFEELIKDENSKIKLKTEIEWQVKPGHLSDLLEVIEKHKYLAECFNLKTKNLVLGKTDYMIQENKSDNLIANFHLVRDLVRDKKCEFFKYARKVRTYVFLEPDITSIENCEKGNHGHLTSEVILDHLAVKTPEFEKINRQLKCLKVSRQLRLKILKILSNYNNGILDPILFTYFLDFTIFKNNLIENINDFYEKSIEKNIEIKELEKKLNNYIDVFQEGYNVRFLNGYQFENISDFDLDFNSSIQQLLTSYSSVVYEYGKLFYKEKTYFPILQLNNVDTQSDYISINYSVHQLTSPEFVFATLTKEILNHIKVDNDYLILIIKEIEDFIPKLKRIINESYFDDLIDSDMVDVNYFIIDAIRCKTTFQGNFKLFEHWFWLYNFQNTSLYDSSGMFNEQHLRVEMFRLMLIQKFFSDKESNPLKDPAPEMYTYWVKHFKKIDIITDEIYKYARNPVNSNNVFCKLKNFIDEMLFSNVNIKTFSKEKLDEFDREIVIRALKSYYNENNRDITLLKRNWKDGTILESHFPLYEDVLFAIDQTGGVFFSNTSKMQEYFSLNSKYLLNILDFSAIHKKRFILDLIDHKTNL